MVAISNQALHGRLMLAEQSVEYRVESLVHEYGGSFSESQARHETMLEKLPESICEKIGFKGL